MRIDAFNRVSQLYQTNNPKKLKSSGKQGKPDSLEISQIGRDYQVARTAVEKAPDVRADKVADIKKRMAAGTYEIDMDALAEKLTSGYVF